MGRNQATRRCPQFRRALAILAFGVASVNTVAVAAQDPMGDSGPHRRGQAERGKRGGQGGPGGPPQLWSHLSDDDRTRVREFLAEHFPKMHLELERLRDVRPERYLRRMRRVVPEMWHLMDQLETRPQLGLLTIQERRIDMDMWRLARRFRSTDDAKEQDALRSELTNLARQAFDCRHKRRDLQIGEMESRLTELKQRQTQSAKLRDQLIDQEVKDRLERRMPRQGRGERRPR